MAHRAPRTGSSIIYIVTSTAGAMIIQVAGSLLRDLGFDGVDYPPFTRVLYNMMGRLTGGAALGIGPARAKSGIRLVSQR